VISVKMVINGVICPYCHGKGIKIDYVMVAPGEDVTVETVCPECGGTGVIRYQGDRTTIEWERE